MSCSDMHPSMSVGVFKSQRLRMKQAMFEVLPMFLMAGFVTTIQWTNELIHVINYPPRKTKLTPRSLTLNTFCFTTENRTCDLLNSAGYLKIQKLTLPAKRFIQG